MEQVELRVREEEGIARRAWPLSRGVPLPEGAVQSPEALWMEDESGAGLAAQWRVLGRWPDGSLKWVLADFQADLPAGGEARLQVGWGERASRAEPREVLEIEVGPEYVRVCTGPLRFAVSRLRFGLLEDVELGQRQGGSFQVARRLSPARGGEAWARICESQSDGGTRRRIYGMGGRCLASLGGEEYRVEIEEEGPLRAVITCRGALEAGIPGHHYGGYRPLRFITRIHAYAGQAFVRVLHTLIFTANPRETQVEELGLQVPLALGGERRLRLEARRPVDEKLGEGEYALLSQRLDDHFVLDRFAGPDQVRLAEGERVGGWVALEDGEGGAGAALSHMAEAFPAALGASAQGLDIYPWRDPEGKRLSFARYAEEVAWHEGEGVYADGTGAARTSELFLFFYRAVESQTAPQVLRGLLAWPQAAVDPAWVAQCRAAGGLAACDAERFPRSERMLAGFVDWLARNVELGRWYGYLDWGDMRAAWEEGEDEWRFHGRWGWCNSEWDPRHGVWVQYLRTGESRYFRLGEAMTRHSVDVDTCHFHPFRPYMVGGCYRHSVDHFGDEPCASHTFLDNWVDHYWLTGDLRTLEVLREAGAFFLRYRWSAERRYSFSLRSIANVLRGLLYVHQVTGEARFAERAEEVYAAIAGGQNEDGSWHKRFHSEAEDRLPDQGPYGMATEGTTQAVEMGTAAPFSDEEFHQLWPQQSSLRRVLPYAEQKGYQTHYLMVGLELMHRMTGRQDLAALYVRAVDWFCGGAGRFDQDFALAQRYSGVLCAHLAYAWRLSGERRYLEVGRGILEQLIAQQNWGEDPRRRGAVEMSPTALSLLFFGVPPLLGALAEAGMGEEC